MVQVAIPKPLGLSFGSNGTGGFHVTKIMDGGNALATGQIQVGMDIVAVNGTPLQGIPKPDVVVLIKESGAECWLDLRPGLAPAGASMASSYRIIHEGIGCDACRMMPLEGIRYNLIGLDYDLCEADYTKLSGAEQANYAAIHVSQPRPSTRKEGSGILRTDPAPNYTTIQINGDNDSDTNALLGSLENGMVCRFCLSGDAEDGELIVRGGYFASRL
jgi:hypothetical protein